jgi:hypothetical protein
MGVRCSNCGQDAKGGMYLIVRGIRKPLCPSCGFVLKNFLLGLAQTREAMRQNGGLMAMLKKAV